MLATLTRLLRPRRATPDPAAGAATPVVEGVDAATGTPPVAGPRHDPAADPGLARRFLVRMLGPAEAFPEAQATELLARMQALASGEAFHALKLPRLPAVVPLLMQALRDDDAGLAEVARLAARDPALVGEVMRVANSAYYRGGAPLRDLPHAVQRLGRDGVRQVVARLLLRPIHPAAPGSAAHRAAEGMREHAMRVGTAAAALARSQRFDAQLAGIVGAAGSGVLLGEIARAAPELLQAEAVHARFLACAWRISAHAAKAWEFPAATVEALYAHAEGGEARIGLAPTLGLAERLAMLHALAPETPVAELHGCGGAQADLERAWRALQREALAAG